MIKIMLHEDIIFIGRTDTDFLAPKEMALLTSCLSQGATTQICIPVVSEATRVIRPSRIQQFIKA